MTQKREPSNLSKLPKMVRQFDATFRALPARAEDGDEPKFKRFELSISSEYPVRRWYGNEVLIHSAEAVDLSRMNDGAAVLLQHDGRDHIGVVEPGTAKLVNKRLVTEIRFSRAQAKAAEVAQDIEDGIRRNVSIGYLPMRAKLASYSDDEGDTWEIERWQPMEVSIVSVPADPTVGFDRSERTYPVDVDTSIFSRSRTMDPTKETGAAGSGNPAPVVTAGADATQRASEIVRLAVKHGMADRAQAWIDGGKTVDQISREILDARAAAQAAPSGAVRIRSPEFPGKDMRRYSYSRALLQACLMREGKGAFDGLEGEVDQEIRRHLPAAYQQRNGVFVPMDTRSEEEKLELAYGRRALDSLTPGAAPELVFDRPGELIELLRNIARVIAKGATVLSGLSGPVPFPKQTGGVAASWVQENPASDVGETNPTFGTVSLSPKTLQAYVAYSRQLLAQASLNVEAMVRNELAIAHGLAVDRAALHGSGAGNEPLGIYKSPGVNTVAMAGVPTYAKLVDMLGAVADDNAYMGNLGFLTTALMAAKLMQILEFAAAGSRAIWTGDLLEGQVAGYGAAATNQISKVMSTLEPTGGTEHGIVFGNWSECLIGFWGAMELVVDPFTLARKGLIGVTSFQMADIVLRHGESFCVSTGATTV